MFRAMLFTVLFGLVTSVASAQTLEFDVTPTNGPTVHVMLTTTAEGSQVYYNGVHQGGAAWTTSEGNIHIYDGMGHAVLGGAAGVDVGATGTVYDGNVDPPNNVAGSWKRVG